MDEGKKNYTLNPIGRIGNRIVSEVVFDESYYEELREAQRQKEAEADERFHKLMDSLDSLLSQTNKFLDKIDKAQKES